MASKRTLKALEELIKTEYMAVAALDAALEQVQDSKLRKQYRKFRDEHMKQAQRLNDRLEELGGEPLPYEVGTGKGQASLWGRLTGMREETSIEGMRIGAERGIKRYIDHIDDIDDAKTLSIIRKNLEAKQDEMRWYDEQAAKERAETLETKLEVSREKVEAVDGKRKGGLPLPLLIVAGAIGAAAYFLLRRGEEAEYEDYGEEAFRYETEETGSEGGYTSTGTYSGGPTSDGEISTPS
jgi:bacterioferritin (cytochrome b1)